MSEHETRQHQTRQHGDEPVRGLTRLRTRRLMPGITVAALAGAARVPLTIKLRLVSANSGRAVAGQAVQLWQCDQDGDCVPGDRRAGRAGDRRAVDRQTGGRRAGDSQASDNAGWVTFTGTFPDASAGRWPHVHFAVSDGDKLLALPADVCSTVYATTAYTSSRGNLCRSNLTTAGLFRDGWSLEMASVTGDVRRGFVATRTVGV